MSFARKGPDSDVYVIGTSYKDGAHVIECCGCLFTPRGKADSPPNGAVESVGAGAADYDWYLEAFPAFTSRAAAVEHMESHLLAGHKVPADAIERVRRTDWIAA